MEVSRYATGALLTMSALSLSSISWAQTYTGSGPSRNIACSVATGQATMANPLNAVTSACQCSNTGAGFMSWQCTVTTGASQAPAPAPVPAPGQVHTPLPSENPSPAAPRSGFSPDVLEPEGLAVGMTSLAVRRQLEARGFTSQNQRVPRNRQCVYESTDRQTTVWFGNTAFRNCSDDQVVQHLQVWYHGQLAGGSILDLLDRTERQIGEKAHCKSRQSYGYGCVWDAPIRGRSDLHRLTLEAKAPPRGGMTTVQIAMFAPEHPTASRPAPAAPTSLSTIPSTAPEPFGWNVLSPEGLTIGMPLATAMANMRAKGYSEASCRYQHQTRTRRVLVTTMSHPNTSVERCNDTTMRSVKVTYAHSQLNLNGYTMLDMLSNVERQLGSTARCQKRETNDLVGCVFSDPPRMPNLHFVRITAEYSVQESLLMLRYVLTSR